MWRAVRLGSLGLLAVVVVALLGALAWGPGAGSVHGAPVGVVGPGVAASVLSDTGSGDAGSDQDTSPVRVPFASRDEGLAALRAGEVVTLVVLDLAGTRDDLWIDRSRNRELVEALIASTRAKEHRVGRTVRVRDAYSSRPGAAEHVDLVALVAALAGFALGLGAVVARWARRRPVGKVPRMVLVVAVGATAVGVGAAAWADTGATGADWAAQALLLGVVAATSAALPLGFALAAGQTGVVVAALVQLTLLAPVALRIDTLLLPAPWTWFWSWTSPGAARAALSSSDAPETQVWLAALVWLVASALVGFSALRRRGGDEGPMPLVRAMTAAVPAVAVLVVCALLLPVRAHLAEAGEPLASTTECVPVGRLDSVRALNRAVRGLNSDGVFGGADIGASAPLGDGRSVWLFGDSVRTGSSLPSFTRNSMVLVDADPDGHESACLSVVVPPANGAVIPNRPDGVGYWPMSVTADHRPGYDMLLVTAQRVRGSGTGVFDFSILGASAAVFVVPHGGTPQLLEVRDVTPDLADDTRPMWGAATAVHGTWAYVYATAQSAREVAFGYNLRVARVPVENPLDLANWRYWDGSGWSREPGDAVELIGAVEGVSQTLSVWPGDDGTWYALSKRNDYLGQDLVVWTAPAPTGPFTAHPASARIPSDVEAGHLRYMPLAHPEILPADGSVVVSYSNNRSDAEAVRKDPSLYRPTFLRVPLPR